MVAIVSLTSSFLGILLLFLFKEWEMRHPVNWYRSARARADRKVVVLGKILGRLPTSSRVFLVRFLHRALYRLSEVMLLIIRWIERRLLRLINMIKGRGEINKEKGSVSLFLASIAASDEKEKNQEER
jgi:hypothetical protein